MSQKVSISSGVPESEQMGSFQNATLQGVGADMAVSISTRISVPESVVSLGESAVSAHIAKVLDAASRAVDGALEFEVQLGPSDDAKPVESFSHPLLLDVQPEIDGDPAEYTHFDCWPDVDRMHPRSMATARGVLRGWAETLGILELDPGALSRDGSFSRAYLAAGEGDLYPGIMRRALEIVLADGRYAAYQSENFIEIYHLEDVRDALHEQAEPASFSPR